MIRTSHPIAIRTAESRVCVSLRWKFTLLLTAVLICANVLVQTVYYQRLHSTQHAQWSARLAALQNTFMTVSSRSSLQLERLASQFAHDIPVNADPLTTNSAVTNPFTAIDALQYLSPSGDRLFAWELEGSMALPPPELTRTAVHLVRTEDRPQTYLDCRMSCMQQAFVPALTQDGTEVIINIGRSGSDVIVDFQKISHADIALLSDSTNPSDPAFSVRSLWNKRVAAATHAGTLIESLDKLAQTYSLDELRTGTTTWIDDVFFAIKAFDLPAETTSGSVTALVLADESASILAMRRAALENLLLGGFGMILVGVLLGAALGRPMKRVQALADALPGLAENRFGEMRDILASHTSNNRIPDEIDILFQAGTELCCQLETLQEQVFQHTRALQDKVQELDQERAFSDLLLDTAPVVIILHTPEGRILRMNRYGHDLTGWPQSDIETMQASELIQAPDKGDDPLQRLHSHDAHTQQIESALRCADGTLRQVTWLHTAIDNEPGRVIMSVGLDITLQRETESRLRWLSGHDAVTGLLNRNGFTQELQNIILDIREQRTTAALLIVDIDNFQDVNDSYGYQNGDSVIHQLGGRIASLLENNAILGRVGSDEFAILLADGDSAAAFSMAEAVSRNLADIPIRIDDRPIHLSITTGIVMLPEHGGSTHELLANATLALSQAKRINPGHAHILTPSEEIRAMRRARMHIRDEIAEALNEDRFIVHFQPIVDMRTCRISHCESLVRMQLRDGGIVMPGAFIDIAEQSGQITAIQHAVVRKVIRRQAELEQAGHSITIGINLAARAFEDPHLLAIIKDLLNETGADPRKLIFEIVESEAIANLTSAQQLMTELTSLGSSFAFDDFGIGFTSFEYLRELPVDYVKIDQSFVRNMRERDTDLALVRSMHEMIRRLGLKSVAEGVGDMWTFEYLHEIGIDYSQGYCISKPSANPPVGADALAIEQRLATEIQIHEAPNVRKLRDRL